LAAPARLRTPTVALLYFGDSTHTPKHSYVFATHKGLQKYRTRIPEAKAAQRKKTERRKDSRSQERRNEKVAKAKENAGGERKMEVGWASGMEEDTDGVTPSWV